MELEELVLQYQKHRSRDLIADIWERVQRLAASIAREFAWLEYDDTMQDAFLVLVYAAAAFDDRRQALFTTYYANRLRWYLFGKDNQDIKVLSLDAVVPGSKSGTTYAELLPDPVDLIGAAEHDADNDAAGEIIRNMLQELPEHQAAAVKAVYWQGMTQAEAARALKTDPAEIRKSIRKAYSFLRQRDRMEILRNYYDESAAYSVGVKGTGLKNFERTWTSATERAAIVYNV